MDTVVQIELVLQTFRMLECMSEKDVSTVTEISKKTGMVVSKVYRMLQTLVSIGYAYKDEYDCYGLTMKISALTDRIFRHFDITQRAYPYMKELSRISEETVHLAQMQDNHIVYLAKVDSIHALRLHSYVGSMAPLYCTSLGKAILAHQPKPEQILEQIEIKKITGNTITDKQLILQQLDKIRRDGYSEDDREHVEHMHCYGAPIINYYGACIGAVSVSTPVFRCTEEKTQKVVIPNLLKAAQEISKLYGKD